MMRCCQKKCHHVSPAQEIVYPVQENVIHNYSEETVKHIHPSHTTVMNHHTINNEHVYPHTTSVENTVNEIDNYNKNEVAGVMNMGFGNKCNCGMGCGGKCGKRRRRRNWW